MENESLATELLHEIKSQAKRWFIAFMIVLLLWFATIGAFLWYISLPVDEVETTVEQTADDYSNNQIVGGDYIGSKAEDNKD